MHTHTRTMFYTSSVAVCRSLLIELDAVLAFFLLMYSAKKKKEGKWAKNANIWPKKTKNAYFGPILAVFGPKILIFMGVKESFGTYIT